MDYYCCSFSIYRVIIVLIIGFLVLFYIIGGINAVLTDLIWGVSIKTDWRSLLAHGFVLFILLIIAAIPQFIISFVVPSLATKIVMFIIYCFNGFIAKSVAGQWESATPLSQASNLAMTSFSPLK